MSDFTRQPWKTQMVEKAVEQWQWSEWMLSKLRTETGKARPPKTEKEIVEWSLQIR